MKRARDASQPTRESRIQHRAVLAGLAVMLLLCLVMLPAEYRLYQRNTSDLEEAASLQAQETAVRLQQVLEFHVGILKLFRENYRAEQDFSHEHFRREAAGVYEIYPVFQAINWLDETGRIRVVYPEIGNLSALDRNVHSVPEAGPVFDAALASDELRMTPPLKLLQGGQGFAVYLPVHFGDLDAGVLNGVFRIEPLFDKLFEADLLDRYALRVTDGGETVFAAGTFDSAYRDIPGIAVRVADRQWELHLAPRVEGAANFHQQFLQQAAVTLLLALAAGVLTAVAVKRQLSLRASEQRFRDLNRLLPDMVCEVDGRYHVTYLNQLAVQELGYGQADISTGLDFRRLFASAENEDVVAALHDQLEGRLSQVRIMNLRCRDGREIACEVTLAAVRDAAGRFQGLRCVLRDISERLEAERALHRVANFDDTTELPNRAMFLQVLRHEVRLAQRSNRRLVLMAIDLDQFKHVNDRLGPSAGDLLLHEAGLRLREALNDEEFVFRVSGDEFAVLFSSLNAHAEIERVAQQLLSVLRKPYRLQGQHEEIVDASIGISVFPDDASTSEQIHMHADAALYEAKSAGGRHYRFFTQEISQRLKERKDMEEALRKSIARGELELYYQPIADVRRGRVVGAEALMRWNHPRDGLVPPMRFIPLAEEIGIIDEMGRWALHDACRQLREWRDAGFSDLYVAVNVSPHQLESGSLIADVRDALESNGVPGAQLSLELTESLLMHDVHHATETLAALKALGVKVAVDDFGTGYSSLAYLNGLPLDVLKIDRAFISPIGAPGGDTRVTDAVIALARSLRLTTIAEGVETREQVQYLLSHYCERMQGYYFSKPKPAAEFRLVLDSGVEAALAAAR